MSADRHHSRLVSLACLIGLLFATSCEMGTTAAGAEPIVVQEDDEQITIETPHLAAAIRKTGYVSGVAGGSLLDKKTGFRDVGYGLDIVDWIMEPGSDEAYRDQLPGDLAYEFGNDYHGNTPKRSIEGPQICTKAGRVATRIVRGADFAAVQLTYRYLLAAPGKHTGSTWTQWLVFPEGERYFLSSDRIDAVNDSPAMFLRIDMPGHIKHEGGDTFSEVYLSYHRWVNDAAGSTNGLFPSSVFLDNFPPDARLNYRREANSSVPERFIRAYHLRDPETGKAGPWLAGMTLDPSSVYEAWCHQRGYVCMIEEIGGRPVRAGESFGAAFVVGFFDSPEAMHPVYDRYRGSQRLQVTERGWTFAP